MSSPSTQPFPSYIQPVGPRKTPPSPTERRSPSAGKRAATRHRLMDACGSLIVRDGFNGVSMTAVAAEAGITRQTVYRYFPNARVLVKDTLMRGGRELLEAQLLIFSEEGDPRDLLVEAVMAALRMIEQNALLRCAWSSRDYPQAMLRATFDAAYVSRAVEGLAPVARRLGWSVRDTHEAYEVIARTVMSFLTIPAPHRVSESELRRVLYRRMLPALGA